LIHAASVSCPAQELREAARRTARRRAGLAMAGQERSWRFGARAPRRFHKGALALAIASPLLGTAFLIAAALAPATAQTRLIEIGENKVGAVRVTQGKSQTLQTTLAFVDLVVGDPEIADVMPLTDRTMYVLGKKLGTTNVAVYDAAKGLVGVIEVEVGYNTPRLAADVEERLPGERARIASANGRTVLSGTMKDSVSAARAVALAKQYGPEVLNDLKVRGSQQVMLEVRFVEASRNAGKEFGVNWQAVGRNFGDPSRAALNFASALGLSTLPSGAPPFGTILGRVLSSGVEADVMIRALEERGLVRRLAEPNLIAMSGEKASFLAGGEFPIPVAGTFQQITVEYKKFAALLGIVDRLFVVTDMTVPGLRLARRMAGALGQRLPDVKPRVIVNRFEQQLLFGTGLRRADVERALDGYLEGTVSNNYKLVREAIDRGLPLDAVKAGSNVSGDLKKIVLGQAAAEKIQAA
jgi:hypothetical protein